MNRENSRQEETLAKNNKPTSCLVTATGVVMAIAILILCIAPVMRELEFYALSNVVFAVGFLFSYAVICVGIAAIVHIIISRGKRRGLLTAFICTSICIFMGLEGLAIMMHIFS